MTVTAPPRDRLPYGDAFVADLSPDYGAMVDSQTFIVLAGAFFGIWLVSDYVRNYLSKCPKCKGSGTLKATWWSGRYRPCPRCGRKGEVPHAFGPKS
ncbi:hypothetical protein Msi02_76990 [Microbispora siamensis]|uniref:Uncharacterized protein n=1 Tax=Microbispora siamensis TaxID=564413 RepID=A0ABQ4GZM3_9ACTN|nr:hypothetical protein Msi02_76990 [Microbispora siamensis]